MQFFPKSSPICKILPNLVTLGLTALELKAWELFSSTKNYLKRFRGLRVANLRKYPITKSILRLF